MTRRTSRALFAVAALVAAGSGAAVVATVATASSPGASAFVPITPCRLFDTRPGDINVGSRATPLAAGETFTVPTWGSNGNCSIPSGATGLSLNVVAIEPTASSFLTVFPAGVARPSASSLNWVAGQAPTPNGVTTRVGGDGRLSFYNLSGTVHLAVDVVGYYEATAGGATGAQGPAGPAGPQGDPGVDPAHVVWVAMDGGDFTTITEALASITDNSAGNRYLVKVAPGTYIEEDGIDLKPYVDVEGSGIGTIVTSADPDGTVRIGVAPTELRQLAVRNSGGLGVSIVDAFGDRVRVSDVTVDVTGGGPTNAFGMQVEASVVEIADVDVTLDGGATYNYGVRASEFSDFELNQVAITVTSSVAGSNCFAVQAADATAVYRAVEATSDSCQADNTAVHSYYSTVEMYDVVATTTALSGEYGNAVDSFFSTARIDGLVARTFGVGSSGSGMYAGFSNVRLSDAYIHAIDWAIYNVTSSVMVSDTVLWGATQNMAGQCSNVMNTDLDPYSCT